MLSIALAAGLQLPAQDLPTAEVLRVPSVFERAMTYPSQALGLDVPGQAVLRCRVNDVAEPAGCRIHSETPGGFGFGKAAMAMRSSYRLAQPGAGKAAWVLLPVTFDPRTRLRHGLAN